MKLTLKQKFKAFVYIGITASLVASLYVVHQRQADPKSDKTSYSQPIKAMPISTLG